MCLSFGVPHYLRAPLEPPMQKLTTPAVSSEAIVEAIRMLRNSRINELLKTDEALHRVLGKLYGTTTLTDVKKEFIRRDLLALRNTSLDINHYGSLVREVKEHGGTGLASNVLFMQELEGIFKKYGF